MIKHTFCLQVILTSTLALTPQVIFGRPRKVEKLNREGIALEDKGKWEAAIAKFRQAIGLDPTYAAPHTNLCIALLQKHDADGALAECREAVRLDPDDAPAHYSLAHSLQAAGDLDAASAEFREASRLDPRDPDAHFYLGKILEKKGDLNGALSEYNAAYYLNPRHSLAREAYERLSRQSISGPPTPTPPAQSTILPDAGTVLGSVYGNQFFGFSYPFPKGWHVQSRQAQEQVAERGHQYFYRENPKAATSETAAEHQVAMQRTFFLFGATGKTGTEIAPPSVQITALDLYSKLSTPGLDELISKLEQDLKAKGAVELQQHRETQIAGHRFVIVQGQLAANPSGQPQAPILEEWAMTIHRGYALAWLFTAKDRDSLDGLANTLDHLTFSSQAQEASAPRQAEPPPKVPSATPSPRFQDEGVFLIYGEKNQLVATENFRWQSDGSYSSECVSSEFGKPQTRQTTITPDKTGQWAHIRGMMTPKKMIELSHEGDQARATVNGKSLGAVTLKPGTLPFHFYVGDYEPALFSQAIRLYDKAKAGKQDLPLLDFLVTEGPDASGSLTMKGTAQTEAGGPSLRLTQFEYRVSRYWKSKGYFTGQYWDFSLWADDAGKIYVGWAKDLSFARKGYESLLNDPRLEPRLERRSSR